MVQIRENLQKQLTNRTADAKLLRTDLNLCALNLFAGIINVLGIKESAP